MREKKTWTTESKHDSEESGFECEFLQVLASTHWDFMFSHVCAVICDKNIYKKLKTILSIKVLRYSLISRIFS